MDPVPYIRSATHAIRPRVCVFIYLLCALAVSAVAQSEIRSPGNLNASLDLLKFANPQSETPGPGQADAPSGAASGAEEQPAVFYAKPGPWGKLRCFYIYLEAPRSLVDEYPLPSPKPRWSFPESTEAQLPKYFKDVGLSESFREALLKPANQSKMGGMIHLFPPVAELEAMTPAARALVYGELRKHPGNEYQAEPVWITTDTAEEFYRTSKLRPELIGKICQMSYRYGNTLAFSDLNALLSFADSDSEARLIFKTFTRTRSLMVHLELPPGTDIAPLLDYWSLAAGLRLKDVEPIMQSILDTRGVERLGLTHILPPLARKLIYTYPSPEFALQGIQPDCHWTSLNFFNHTPQNHVLSERLAASAVLQKFTPVKPPYRYGDILFFLDSEQGSAEHSCIYLADDMVFTKNGRNALRPWAILKMDDVNKLYLHDKVTRVQAYRYKGAAAR